MKYKVGQKVKIVKGDGNCNFEDVGKIVKIARKSYDGWDVDYGNGIPQGNWEEQYLELVNEFQVPFYVDCPTQEIWDKVEKKMFEMGYTWGEKGTNHSSFEKNQPILFCGYLKIPSFPGRTGMFYAQKGDTFLNSAKHIPYRQFLGEEGVMKEREFRVGDKVEITASADNGHFAVGSIGTITEYDKDGTKDYRIKVGVLECWTRNGTYKLITPVEEKEEKHKNLVAEYPLPPMYTLTNDWTNGGGYVSFGVDLGTEQVNPFYKLSKSLMSGFKKATAFIKRLGEPLSTYYSLGWVELENDEFTTTAEGKQALADFTLIGGAKTFEEYAKKELARRKKASKVKDEEED